MSKRLMSSAIAAIVMMASATAYSIVYQNGNETASMMVMMGG
ncbi:hypothetical protein [Parasphingorhabdus sp.]